MEGAYAVNHSSDVAVWNHLYLKPGNNKYTNIIFRDLKIMINPTIHRREAIFS